MKSLARVCLAILFLLAFSGPVNAITIFMDDFNRSDSSTVENEWSEIQKELEPWDVAIANERVRLRDISGITGTDAAIYRPISLLGFSNISVEFRWRALDRTEPNDYLYVKWDLGDDNWVTAWEQPLGGSSFAVARVDLPSDVDNQEGFRIMFSTDVSAAREAAFIDDVSVIAAVPEPATLLILSVGLIGLAGYRKKLTKG